LVMLPTPNSVAWYDVNDLRISPQVEEIDGSPISLLAGDPNSKTVAVGAGNTVRLFSASRPKTPRTERIGGAPAIGPPEQYPVVAPQATPAPVMPPVPRLTLGASLASLALFDACSFCTVDANGSAEFWTGDRTGIFRR